MRLAAVLLALLIGGTSGIALAQDDPDEWQFNLTPYLWLPTIDGNMFFDLPPGQPGEPVGEPDVKIGPAEWWDLLNFAALASGTARKGRFSIMSDFVYLSMTSEEGRIESVGDGSGGSGIPVDIDLGIATRTNFDGLTWTIAGGYTLKETESSTVDVFAGARYFGLDVDLSWILVTAITTPDGELLLPEEGRLSTSVDLWDGIVGIRGRFDIGNGNWYVPYSFDVGAGDSELTWNALAGVAYEYGWGDLVIVYRHLQYEQEFPGLLKDFSFSGPAFGARFRF